MSPHSRQAPDRTGATFGRPREGAAEPNEPRSPASSRSDASGLDDQGNFPAFATAMDDTALRGAALRVYLYLSRTLDFVTYRETSMAVVAQCAHVREVGAANAMRRLCELGYIERGPKPRSAASIQNPPAKRAYTYRLVWSRPT